MQLLNLPPKDAQEKLDQFSVKIKEKYFKDITKAILKSNPVAEIDTVGQLKIKDKNYQSIKDKLIVEPEYE